MQIKHQNEQIRANNHFLVWKRNTSGYKNDRAVGSLNLFHNIIDLLELPKTLRDLRETGTSATLNRLFESKHVRDLKLIAGISCWIFLLGMLLILAVFISLCTHLFTSTPMPSVLDKYVPTIGAMVAISGAVVAWVYRTASIRLGVVDLFASEIMTLCRVGTTVDMVQHSMDALDYVGQNDNSNGTTGLDLHPSRHFTSEENYFPVFSSNSRDLEVLEADVVTNVTAFYTYMKVVRDYFRKAGDIQLDSADLQISTEWRKTWRSIIYMQFLAYETARKAIKDLVEYEPRHVENMIIILLTELVAYRFLLSKFENDFRSARLYLRLQEYRDTAKELEDKIRDGLVKANGDTDEWEKAIKLWPELRDRLGRLHIKVGTFSERTEHDWLCVAESSAR